MGMPAARPSRHFLEAVEASFRTPRSKTIFLSTEFLPGERFGAQSGRRKGPLTTGMFDEEGLSRRRQWNGGLISSGTY